MRIARRRAEMAAMKPSCGEAAIFLSDILVVPLFEERKPLPLARVSERARVDGTIDRDPTCRRARELL